MLQALESIATLIQGKYNTLREQANHKHTEKLGKLNMEYRDMTYS